MSVCIYVSYTSLSVIVNFVSIYCTCFRFRQEGKKKVTFTV